MHGNVSLLKKINYKFKSLRKRHFFFKFLVVNNLGKYCSHEKFQLRDFNISVLFDVSWIILCCFYTDARLSIGMFKCIFACISEYDTMQTVYLIQLNFSMYDCRTHIDLLRTYKFLLEYAYERILKYIMTYRLKLLKLRECLKDVFG